MKRIIVLLVVAPYILLAANGSGEVDIIERTINFVIFFALIYYFAADKIKAIFVNRREEIAGSLARIQEKLQASKKEKQQALKDLEEAKRIASEVVETAHKETYVITQKIEENARIELENLVKQFNESMAFERRKIEKSVINEILDEVLHQDSISLNKEVLTQSLLKKAI
ncbi:F0F1 ATP synthase subunit B [Helicobacter apodemus]|uniref:ATP synthase subunit b n=1 Tax=Helicobacter apodemus TaxID=135569 RepID=A0A2U8FEJ4_9HELI|nr:F0F1 ATP synthase subunit B [Helicobacter apodemus]AWI33845.1 F0F1 ATP synthase subunit B [Helicobacter apodemus]